MLYSSSTVRFLYILSLQNSVACVSDNDDSTEVLIKHGIYLIFFSSILKMYLWAFFVKHSFEFASIMYEIHKVQLHFTISYGVFVITMKMKLILIVNIEV